MKTTVQALLAETDRLNNLHIKRAMNKTGPYFKNKLAGPVDIDRFAYFLAGNATAPYISCLRMNETGTTISGFRCPFCGAHGAWVFTHQPTRIRCDGTEGCGRVTDVGDEAALPLPVNHENGVS